MRIETQRSYACGFFLTEADLRKLYTILFDAIRRINKNSIPCIAIRATLRNNTIIESDTLSEILNIDNVDSKKITSLKITAESMTSPNTFLEITFINTDSSLDFFNFASIKYWISLPNQDELFLATTKLESFIKRISVPAPNQIMGVHFGQRFIFVTLLISFILILSLFSIPANYVAIFLLLLILTSVIWWRFFPIYSFYWSDYIKEYNRRRSIGFFIAITLFVSVLIGVFTNYISKIIGIS